MAITPPLYNCILKFLFFDNCRRKIRILQKFLFPCGKDKERKNKTACLFISKKTYYSNTYFPFPFTFSLSSYSRASWPKQYYFMDHVYWEAQWFPRHFILFCLEDGSREPASNFVSRKHKPLFLPSCKSSRCFLLFGAITHERTNEPNSSMNNSSSQGKVAES